MNIKNIKVGQIVSFPNRNDKKRLEGYKVTEKVVNLNNTPGDSPGYWATFLLEGIKNGWYYRISCPADAEYSDICLIEDC